MLATHHLALHEDKVGCWDLIPTCECQVRQRGLSLGLRGMGTWAKGLRPLHESGDYKHLVAEVWVEVLPSLTFFLLPV